MAHESHYSHFLLGLNPLMQGLEHNHELLGIESEIEMPQVPPKHHSSHSPNNFIHRDLPESSNKNFGMATAVTTWPVNDSSSMSLFACQGSEQLNRKLSLSLFNVKPADTIAVPESSHHSGPGIRWQSKAVYPQQEQLFMQERREYSTSQRLFHLKNSKYLKPVQELLGECCNIGGASSSKEKPKKAGHWEELEPSSSWHLSLFSMNHLELHKLKIKLFSMLEEVDKKYRKYRHQMKTAVSLFESTAGGGSANVYTTLASKAMSRHFRRLKDGIVVQINAVKKAMGEKDPITPAGVTRGQTPRLKLLDQCIRHQKAFQQGVVQQLPWRPQRGLPELSVSILRAWLFEHFLHPYPNDVDKIILARQTGLSRSQVSNWFINARVRIWKPMVEEMYLEETKELNNQSKHPTGHQYSNIQNPNSKSIVGLDLKPLPVQLLNDSESLASVINSSHHGDQIHRFSNKTLLPHQSQQQQQQQQVSGAENFSVVDFDFSSYSDFASDNFRSSVSLTLGLQQHNRGGMSLPFSPATQQPLLFGKEHVDHGQQLVEFSILDGEAQTFAQRNLMGTQLLHDLAG